MKDNCILFTDGYKLDHRRQYPKGTEYVFSNWTPRSNKFYPEATDGVTVFGIQYLIKKYLIDDFNENFFSKPKDEVCARYQRFINGFLGPNTIGTDHIAELHDLGYLPIEIKALPEGTLCPIRVPMLTIINTDPRFFWLTNYLETLLSNVLWLPMTSATTARLAKKELKRHATKTGFADQNFGFLVHDFSMRGMQGIESAIMSGLGHLTAFNGSETLPAVEAAEDYYGANMDKELVAGTVPATEHSVMCAGGKVDELETYRRLITEVYPSGFVSIVSDTWDYWNVVTNYTKQLHNEIMARDGRVVIRPDSGDPVRIICGYLPEEVEEIKRLGGVVPSETEIKGSYELLWEEFGGTINEAGYKVLDSHIGMIYGDSITLDRQKKIYEILEKKGFAATNLVLGLGSYTYVYNTRDTLGFAQKATWCQVNGVAHELFKDPKTDSGVKKSLKGLIRVDYDQDGKIVAYDQQTKDQEKQGLLKTVFKDGKIVKEFTLAEVRENVDKSL